MNITRDELFRVVCLIATPTNGKCGTGSFVSHEGKYYLVTATHVKNDVDASTIIVFGDINNKSYTDILSAIKIGDWKSHSVADLSILELDSNKLSKYYSGRFLPSSEVLTDFSLSRDIELTVCGFPRGLGTALTGSVQFSPFTFRSFPSSNILTLNRADTNTPCDFYCLENPSMGGYSGGPVFDLGYLKTPMMQQNYGSTLIKGFVHGTMSDNTGGKIALITPAKYLLDIL